MSKRFTDTKKHRKPFFRGLDTPYKLLWIYILDECDHAGIWDVDFPVARVCLNVDLDEKEALVFFNSEQARVVEIEGGKWFLPGFVYFQYGQKDGSLIFNLSNRLHKSVLDSLRKHNALKYINYTEGACKPLSNPFQGVKDKDKDKDKKEGGVGETKKAVKFLLPDWVPGDAFVAFAEMRKKIKKPLTDYAKELVIKDLEKLKSGGHDPRKVLDQSTLKSWQGVYPLKENGGIPQSEREVKQAELKKLNLELGRVEAALSVEPDFGDLSTSDLNEIAKSNIGLAAANFGISKALVANIKSFAGYKRRLPQIKAEIEKLEKKLEG